MTLDLLTILALAAAAAGYVVFACWRPHYALLAYAFSLPFESAVVDPRVGSLAKLLGLAWALAYLLRARSLRLGVVPLPAWLWLYWAPLTGLWALETNLTVSFLPTLLLLFGSSLLLADYLSREPARLRSVLWAFSLGAVASALPAMPGYLAGEARRLMSEGPAHLGACLLTAALFFTYVLVFDRLSWRARLPVLGLGMLAVVGLVATGTRSAWVGGALAVALGVLPRLRPRQLLALAVLVAVLAVPILQIPLITEQTVERWEMALPTGGSGRLSIWQIGLAALAERPLFGHGLRNFPLAYEQQAGAAEEGLSGFRLGVLRAPHNIYLAAAVELGLVGAAFLLWWFAALLWRLPRAGPLGTLIFLLLVGYLAQGFFLDILNRKYFWLVLAAAQALLYAPRPLLATARAARLRLAPPSGPRGEPA